MEEIQYTNPTGLFGYDTPRLSTPAALLMKEFTARMQALRDQVATIKERLPASKPSDGATFEAIAVKFYNTKQRSKTAALQYAIAQAPDSYRAFIATGKNIDWK